MGGRATAAPGMCARMLREGGEDAEAQAIGSQGVILEEGFRAGRPTKRAVQPGMDSWEPRLTRPMVRFFVRASYHSMVAEAEW